MASQKTTTGKASSHDVQATRPVAVIDIGTTAIRMTLAQIGPSGIKILDFLQQAVNLGKDTFTRGNIEKASIEECVKILKIFRHILDEHQITHPHQIRAVATTAVREALNRDTFLDRIFMATGIQVEALDEADVTRLTYLSIQPFIEADVSLSKSKVFVTEVGGGSTELLVLHHGNVVLSHTYHLGAIRMRQMLENFRAAVAHQRDLMENTVQRTIEQIQQGVPKGGAVNMIALGGDTRFAANLLVPDRDPEKPAKLPVKKLSKLTDDLLALSVDDIARKYHLSFSEAETVGPALLVYLRLANAFRLKQIVVSHITMRHGLLMEMAGSGVWTDDFKQKILWSAVEVGHKFHFDEAHSMHVTELAKALFHILKGEHLLSPRHELLLKVAAILHDIGLFISSSNHHKHSMYLVQNSELFGLSAHDIFLVSQITRYHRRASPKPTHEEYMSLPREDRLAVSQMAAILRVADALDLSHTQRIRDISGHREDDRLIIGVPDVEDLSLEQMALKQKGPMFEDVYGMNVLLRKQHS
jgi:exopolyphosphatase/guanosine-5'-triphosphate,3'-diphosphate pyrophosphatase